MVVRPRSLAAPRSEKEQIKRYTYDSRITQIFRDESVGETVRLLHITTQPLSGEFYSIFGAGALSLETHPNDVGSLSSALVALSNVANFADASWDCV